MDLYFLENNAYNTLLVQSNGVPIYHIKTPPHSGDADHPHTVITKFVASDENGLGKDESEDREMAHIEVRRWHSGLVEVWAQSFLPSKAHLLSSSEAFTASNGKRYQWRRGEGEEIKLTRFEDRQCSVAHYESQLPATSTSATLKIKLEGLLILDELVAIFIYLQQKRNKREVLEHEKVMLEIDPYLANTDSSRPGSPRSPHLLWDRAVRLDQFARCVLYVRYAPTIHHLPRNDSDCAPLY
ncbi:hypothetical protein D9757_010914 [Collybiopsis confluens]|uniref:DUF6593 domain-containing protein n=1 Tax=Collybiopsis confluens TaxID=2823264 RepID=A0A8H5LQ63_9AGAR|nr:hypothetical protein D9757_010914 [Collybiopsis confluens]